MECKMALRYGNKDGTFEQAGGADPKLKGGLLRSNPFELKEGKADKGRQRPIKEVTTTDDRDEEIKVLKRELKIAGERIVDLEKALADMTVDRDHLLQRADTEAIRGRFSEGEQQRPWEALGIPKRTYYNRKKAGKL